MFNYIIIQAGGKGTRMEQLTKNKPKALVPVDNLPMLFHLFRKYPEKKFIIIGDYKFDVLKRYLKAFATVDYKLVDAGGHNGTCAGLQKAADMLPEKERFLLIWCDLVLPDDFEIPDVETNLVGLSGDFSCRWKYENEHFIEERSMERGVAGFFVFRDKSVIADVPSDGEFVRWLGGQPIRFDEIRLSRTHEYGLFSEWDKLPKLRCRPFNRTWMEDGKFYKEAIDDQGRTLAAREIAWYKKVQKIPQGKSTTGDSGIINIPTIYGYDPLCMELVKGKNVYEYADLPRPEKQKVLSQIIQCLRQVHSADAVPADRDSYYEAYIGKTFSRLEKVKELVPFAQDATVVINGRECRNIFFHREEVESLIMRYFPKEFPLIHGDCTFSNMMLTEEGKPVLIDPRGYFGNTELYGDAAYDWAKLYYSIVGNYDRFNLKHFRLDISEDGAWLETESNGWEDMEDEFFRMLEGEVTLAQMHLMHALIWLSLTTYAWEDYDSICGAFYNGLYYLEEALSDDSAFSYFEKNDKIIEDALKSISKTDLERLISSCEMTLRSGHRIVASGLGKNVPICDKFVGTMLSLGLDAGFLHTNSAVHGDMGMVRPGDLVILLTKSGNTSESVYLAELLMKREGVQIWLLSFEEHSMLADMLENRLIVHMEHEGDQWNIVPNNSTTLNLIVLQTVAIELSRRLGLELERDFKPNHPGGDIGNRLKNM